VKTTTVSPDLGIAAWLGSDEAHAAIFGLRFDTRSAYVTDSAHGPLLWTDATFLAPDRLVTLAPGAPITFDGDKGLTLSPGATAFVTDATFASFALDLAITSAAPLVVLRDEAGSELELGGTDCAAVPPPGATALHAERDGATLRVRFDAGDTTTCTWQSHEEARLSVGLRGRPDATSSAKNLVIVRR
jgi:hypothetical protein